MEVLVTDHPFVSGWPEHNDPRAMLLPLETVLTERFVDSDVHFTAYTTKVARRHTTASLTRANEAGIEMLLAVFDVDGPGHEATEKWWEGEEPKVHDLVRLGYFVYRTRGGYRIVTRLPSPTPIRTDEDARTWRSIHAAWRAHLKRVYNIEADPKCGSWMWLFRAPHTLRDDTLQELPTFGNPSAIGQWDPDLIDADYSVELPKKEIQTNVQKDCTSESSGSTAAILAAAWPAKGRHTAQLALAGGLKKDGWSKERALEFLCDVCRAAGNEDRPKRKQTIEDTWGKEKTTGWPELGRHVGADVAQVVRDRLNPNDKANQELLEAFTAEPVQRTPGAIQWGGWDALQTPPVYLLEGLIPEGKVVTFFAEGGSVKTWSALALAMAVATGNPWLGRYRVQQGKALYLDFEDGPYEFHRRVRYLSGGQDVPGLGYRYSGKTIDQPEFWKDLEEEVKANEIRLIVIDSVRAASPGDADENDSRFAYGVQLAGPFTENGCTVLFVHHANKAGGMRGTGAVRDQSDVVFKFEPETETDDIKRMRMVNDKPGPQKRPLPVNIELNDKGLTTFEDTAAEVSRNVVSDWDLAAAIRLHLSETEALTTVEALRKKIKRRKGDVLNTLNEMIADKEVTKIGKGYILDSNEKRVQRVRALLSNGKMYATEGEIARHAHVDTLFVDDMRIAGSIFRSAEGVWKCCN